MTAPTLLTTRQVADRLGIKVARVNQLAAKHDIGWKPTGGPRAPRFFTEADVVAMAAHRRPVGRPKSR